MSRNINGGIYSRLILMSTIVFTLSFSADLTADGFPIGVYHDPVTVHFFRNDTMDSALAASLIAQLDTFGVKFVIGDVVRVCWTVWRPS